MTMPHLMNCEHSDSGWCLDCVKKLQDGWDERFKKGFGILKMNDQEMYDFARKIAILMDVPEEDGLFYVDDIVTIDGNPWVDTKDFIRIFQEMTLTDFADNV